MYPVWGLHVPSQVCNAHSMTNAQPSAARLHFGKGDRLGKALSLENVSHAEMAQILGVSRNTIGNYIAERTPISDGYVRLWAMRTGVSYGELKTGIPDGPSGSPVTSPYRRKPRNKPQNWGKSVTPKGGTVGRTSPEEGSGTQSERAA